MPYPGTMMTLEANAIMTPTSDASIGFRLPVTSPVAAPPVSPKPENNTLPTERFIAFAINCVSSVPADPTTVPAMIIAGTVVGSAGTLLTQLMAKAMNRSVGNVLFSGFGDTGGAATGEVTGSLKPIEASDVGVMMAFASKVIVVPGYGMAVAQAQHKIWELCQLLLDRGVTVKFAIHPV